LHFLRIAAWRLPSAQRRCVALGLHCASDCGSSFFRAARDIVHNLLRIHWYAGCVFTTTAEIFHQSALHLFRTRHRVPSAGALRKLSVAARWLSAALAARRAAIKGAYARRALTGRGTLNRQAGAHVAR